MNSEPLLPVERDAVSQVSSNEKLRSRQQRGSFMAVMDPWDPPMRIKTLEKSSANLSWFDLSNFLWCLGATWCVCLPILLPCAPAGADVSCVFAASTHFWRA
eukprot:s876_g4.t1